MDQHGSLCDVAIRRKFLRFQYEVLRGERHGDVKQSGEEINDQNHNECHQNVAFHDAVARYDLSHEQCNVQFHDVAHHEVTLAPSDELNHDKSNHRDGQLAQLPYGILDDKYPRDEESHEAHLRNVLSHRDELE